ncbi:ABC transporter ATP-binding protein [Aquamicrobium sp.]|uniref:ABC transporter ATP-binding protein n=1 Tax=Aquamicrobium sp. TaxID=1872579 RepID=UPI002583379D|nr:ABC transporter ATP-binding protein [Aquamicrobium sp.]MCK9552497.1 ABC transporter ATP-binding protein [Aquamicrobium sp.]
MTSSSDVVLRASGGRVVYNEGEPNQVEAVRNVSLELRRGEVLALVGPSGCGKTTLFNAIAGLIPLQGGRIEVSGKQVDKATGHVGYMLQKDLLLPWRTVLDNVTLGLEVRGTPAAKARVIAMDLIHRYGLAGFENSKPSGLSGGMRQRVALMRTLAFDPEVILLDEPFSALDFQTRLLLQADVTRIIKEQAKSVILITHDIGEAISMADRIVVLTNRPSTVKAVHEVAFRDETTDAVNIRTHPGYQAMFGQIWSELEIRREAA